MMNDKDKVNKDRRLKIFYLSRSSIIRVLCSMATQKCVPWTEDLPKDVEVMNVGYDPTFDRFAFILQSATFPEVEECAKLEEIVPIYTWVRCITDEED